MFFLDLSGYRRLRPPVGARVHRRPKRLPTLERSLRERLRPEGAGLAMFVASRKEWVLYSQRPYDLAVLQVFGIQG